MQMELALLATFSTYALLLAGMTKEFKIKCRYALVFLVPLSVFAIGYRLRLSGVTEDINLGFFLTDSSYLFVYILFAFFLLLGQLKYWRKA